MSNPGTTPPNCPKCQTALLNAPGIGQDRLVAELNRRCHRMEVAIINIRSYAKKVGLKNLEADCDEALQHD